MRAAGEVSCLCTQTCIACCLFFAFVLTTFITIFIFNIHTHSSRVFWPFSPCCLSSQTPSGKFGARQPQKRMSSLAKPQTQAFMTALPAFGCASLHQRLSSTHSQVAPLCVLEASGMLLLITLLLPGRKQRKHCSNCFPYHRAFSEKYHCFKKWMGWACDYFQVT